MCRGSSYAWQVSVAAARSVIMRANSRSSIFGLKRFDARNQGPQTLALVGVSFTSGFGTFPTCRGGRMMSPLKGKTDLLSELEHFRFGPPKRSFDRYV
jgi:hypothetical protein